MVVWFSFAFPRKTISIHGFKSTLWITLNKVVDVKDVKKKKKKIPNDEEQIEWITVRGIYVGDLVKSFVAKRPSKLLTFKLNARPLFYFFLFFFISPRSFSRSVQGIIAKYPWIGRALPGWASWAMGGHNHQEHSILLRRTEEYKRVATLSFFVCPISLRPIQRKRLYQSSNHFIL